MNQKPHTKPVPSSQVDIDSFLQGHAHWAVENGMLVRTFEAASFLVALDYVKAVGVEAEAADHHPDIDIRSRKVTIRLVTHDAGNRISARDLKLAQAFDLLFSSRFISR
jgi:4a-hydroxytetrahydrobiopterin dehydratase